MNYPITSADYPPITIYKLFAHSQLKHEETAMFGFAHVELPALNLEREGKFYAAIFNWKLQDFYGNDYRMIVTPDGDMIGGLTKVLKIHFAEDYVNFVEVENVDKTIAAAEKIGGSRVGETKELPEGMGFYGKIKTPDGYCIGVWAKK